MRDAASDKNNIIKDIHLNLLRKISEKRKKICNMSSKLSVAENTKLSVGFPNVNIPNKGVSKTFDNYDDHATSIEASESKVSFEKITAELDSFSSRIIHSVDNDTMDAAESQVPVEKIAAELDSFNLKIVDSSVDSEKSPDWNFSDELYDDLIDLSGDDFLEIVNDMDLVDKASFDDYLEVANDIDVDELDEYLAQAEFL